MLAYFFDQKKLSFVASQNSAGVVPRPTGDSGFIYVVDSNMSGEKLGKFIYKDYQLITTIEEDLVVKENLVINYVHSGLDDVGEFENRLRIYLPFGVKIKKVLWADNDITRNLEIFSDYGRSAMSIFLTLPAASDASLSIDYELPRKLILEDGKLLYRLNLIKQPGSTHDNFNWKIIYPSGYISNLGDSQNFIFNSDQQFELILNAQ